MIKEKYSTGYEGIYIMAIKEKMKTMGRSIFFSILTILAPILFELLNIFTGSWVNENNEIIITNGKIVVILLALLYLYIMVRNEWKEFKEKSLQSNLKKKNDDYYREMENMSSLISYSSECVKKQNGYLKQGDAQIRELESLRFATTLCDILRKEFMNVFEAKNVTVNIYQKYHKGERLYSKMIAHEGHISQPKFYGLEKELKQKGNNYYCEKLMLKEERECAILLSHKEVANAFGIPIHKCKYYQYISMPIIDPITTQLKYFVEFNVHNKCEIRQNKNEVIDMLNEHFICFKEYMLLMISVENYAQTVKNKLEN